LVVSHLASADAFGVLEWLHRVLSGCRWREAVMQGMLRLAEHADRRTQSPYGRRACYTDLWVPDKSCHLNATWHIHGSDRRAGTGVYGVEHSGELGIAGAETGIRKPGPHGLQASLI
jgi:hypothetical protein